MEIVLYLPQKEYGTLRLSTMSGNIDVPGGFSFADADIRNISGGVGFASCVKNNLYIKTVSGKLRAENTNPKSLDIESTSGAVEVGSANIKSDLIAKTVSGSIKLTDIECQSVSAENVSGKAVFSRLVASESVRIKSISGGVELLGCDADSLWIKTTSGSVSGTLLTEKAFLTNTVSGSVNVPRTISGGRCEVQTVSGSIRFEIEQSAGR